MNQSGDPEIIQAVDIYSFRRKWMRVFAAVGFTLMFTMVWVVYPRNDPSTGYYHRAWSIVPQMYEIDQCLDITEKKIACCATTHKPAMGGIDLVALQDADVGSRPLIGSEDFTTSYAAGHNTYTFLFLTEENMNSFNEDPLSYLPAFGGFCVYQVANSKDFTVTNAQYNLGPSVDLVQWDRLDDGRIVFFENVGNRISYTSDKMATIQAANQRWLRWFGTKDSVVLNTNCFTNTLPSSLKPFDVSVSDAGWNPFVH